MRQSAPAGEPARGQLESEPITPGRPLAPEPGVRIVHSFGHRNREVEQAGESFS
jgi:hypothetical protein